MRHLVLALMILLLPLRGWAGDAMATQMAGMSVTANATETGADRAHEMQPEASFDHQNQAFEATPAMPPAATPVPYQSAFEGYRAYSDDNMTNWKATNDEVARIGMPKLWRWLWS